MQRLVVFGCSLAYGVGLPDCCPPVNSSKLGWAQITADSMKRHLVNKSFPGSSNKRIWYEISCFKFEPTDIVLISWSYPNRYSIFKSSRNIINLHHNSPNEESENYYKNIYSKYDSEVMTTLYVNHANRLLKDLNINVYNLIVEKHYKHLLDKTNIIPLHICSYERAYPKALDNAHIGLAGNQAFAVDLLNYIGVEHNITDVAKPYGPFKRFQNFLREINWKHIRL